MWGILLTSVHPPGLDGFQYNTGHECGGSFTNVTGVVFYQYEAHSINNRYDADLVGYTAPTEGC